MNTSQKGNRLEDRLFEYLCEQKVLGNLVYGAYTPDLVKIFKKKRYYCIERKGLVEFDVVIESYREGGNEPHLRIIFECKNHTRPVEEGDITDFSDKLSRMFKHAAKGVVVSTSRLQKGAESIAKSRGLGIVKFIDDGLEIIAERTGRTCVEHNFVAAQMFSSEEDIKSLKFSAYHDGNFFSSTNLFLASFDPAEYPAIEPRKLKEVLTIPFISQNEIQKSSEDLLKQIEYRGGAVDLANVCSHLGINLTHSEDVVFNEHGASVLGHANFDRRLIQINFHQSKQRERFTISHEIGHFYLQHDKYLRSESVVESDFFSDRDDGKIFNYERLEHQANVFAADLLLPDEYFLSKVDEIRGILEMSDRGHGYIFVDDQPCNYRPYNQLITCLQFDFDVSAQAIEVKLGRKGLLTDRRVRFRKPKP